MFLPHQEDLQTILATKLNAIIVAFKPSIMGAGEM